MGFECVLRLVMIASLLGIPCARMHGTRHPLPVARRTLLRAVYPSALGRVVSVRLETRPGQLAPGLVVSVLCMGSIPCMGPG